MRSYVSNPMFNDNLTGRTIIFRKLAYFGFTVTVRYFIIVALCVRPATFPFLSTALIDERFLWWPCGRSAPDYSHMWPHSFDHDINLRWEMVFSICKQTVNLNNASENDLFGRNNIVDVSYCDSKNSWTALKLIRINLITRL